jgi:hypothetical protein
LYTIADFDISNQKKNFFFPEMSCVTDDDEESSDDAMTDSSSDSSTDSEAERKQTNLKEEEDIKVFQQIDPDSTPIQRYLNFLECCRDSSLDRPNNEPIDWDRYFEDGYNDRIKYMQWLLAKLDLSAEIWDGLTPFELFLRTCLEASGVWFAHNFKDFWAASLRAFITLKAPWRTELVVDMYFPTEERVYDAEEEDDAVARPVEHVKKYTADDRYDEWPYEGNMKKWLSDSKDHYLRLIDLLGTNDLFDWQYVHDQFDWSLIREEDCSTWPVREQIENESLLCYVLIFGFGDSDTGSRYIWDDHVLVEFRRRKIQPFLYDALPMIPKMLIDHVLMAFIS